MNDDVRARLRRLLLAEVRPRFAAELGERWQSAAADEIGVSQSTISRLVGDPPDGGSPQFVEALAAYLNLEPASIMYGTRDEVPRFRDLPGYARALADAKKRIAEQCRAIEPWALEKAGDFKSHPIPAEITPDLLIALATIQQRDPALSTPDDDDGGD